MKSLSSNLPLIPTVDKQSTAGELQDTLDKIKEYRKKLRISYDKIEQELKDIYNTNPDLKPKVGRPVGRRKK